MMEQIKKDLKNCIAEIYRPKSVYQATQNAIKETADTTKNRIAYIASSMESSNVPLLSNCLRFVPPLECIDKQSIKTYGYA